MEDVKWLLKRYGSLIVLMAAIVITGSVALGKRDTKRNAEEVGEPPAMIESAEPVSILTAEEEQGLQDEAMSAAKECMELYKEIEIAYPETEYSYIRSFSEKQRKDVVKRLGEQGFVSVSDDMNMENYQKMEDFYSAYLSGRDAMITVFDVYREGNIGARTFIHRNGKIQSFYVSVGWREGGIPEIKDFGSKDLEEIRLTEKGYFIYTNTEVVAHGNLREYYRVKPLSDECRELTKKYIYGLSFVNYNMLVTNWDADNVEEILMPCMFEDIYRVYTKEPFRAEGGLIPAEMYERVMTTCFPVSVEQVREYCGYHADVGGYEYEMIFARQFPPFGEVVDYRQGADGTITLYVDGVWIDHNSDHAFTNQIVVKPFPDGTFRYLSNTIEQKELELPQIGKGEIDTNLDDHNSIDGDVLIDEIYKYMIPEQSFDVTLDDWGEVAFVSCKPTYDVEHEYASFFLLKDEQILYRFPYRYKDNTMGHEGSFDSVGAVAFRDINDDGKDDIIVIVYYVSGVGPTGMVPRPDIRIFIAGENEFYLAEDMVTDIEQHILAKDMTIKSVCNYLKNND